MRDKAWRGDLYVYDQVGKELNSSVVGLIGFGAIGMKVAKLVQAFGSKVLVYDPFVTDEIIEAEGCIAASLDEILEQSDYVSLHARETEQTRGMIGQKEIEKMQKTAYIINTARGGLIDHAALYAALSEKRIAGAALDIFESEPPEESSHLFQLDNVTATSHLGGASMQAAEIGADVLMKGIYDFIVENKVPDHCVNKEFVNFNQVG